MPKCLTNAEFLERLANVTKSVKPLQSYVKSSIKIKVKCLVCGHIWEVRPNALLSGNGCPKCAAKRISVSRRISDSEFKLKLFQKRPMITYNGNYCDSKTRLLFHCKLCGYSWKQTPSEVLAYGCPHCGVMKRQLSLDEVNARIHKKFSYITIVGRYTKLSQDALFFCKKCKRKWMRKPANVLASKVMGCPFCDVNTNSSLCLSNAEFLGRLKAINNTIEPLEPYYRSKVPIKVRCKCCGNVWKVAPANLLRGTSCKRCANSGPHPSHYLSKGKALQRLNETHPFIKLVGPYRGMEHETQFQCCRCGYVFTNTIRYLMKVAKDCPYCSNICYSRQESILKRFLDKEKVNYQFSYKPLYNPLTNQKLHFDFYLPELNLLIEIQGYQHFRARDLFGGKLGLDYLQLKDQYKRDWAVRHGYCLMYINYNDKTVHTFLDHLKSIHANYLAGKKTSIIGEKVVIDN